VVARGRHVVAFEFLGFGESDKPAGATYLPRHPQRRLRAGADAQAARADRAFAITNLKALTSKLLQSPEQFGWVVDFQRNRFQASLSDLHKERCNPFLGPVIDRNFRGGAFSAFAQMTGHLFEDITRNTTRIPEMEALDIPIKLIWGENDPYLNVGVAEDLRSHLSDACLHRIPAAHWVQVDEPELVASAMLS
jgi:haloalkane dehalogenase